MRTSHPLLYVGVLLAASFIQATAAEPEMVWISSLNLSPIIQGWGKPQANKSVTGTPMTIAGHQYEHGLGTHADSLVRIELSGGATRFSAFVGVDDNAGAKEASIIFKVVGDGKTLFKTGVMRLGQAAEKVDVDVTGIKVLLLLADSAGDGISFDHADWAEAQLRVTGKKPAIVGSPREEAVVLTPKPPPEPRINGARVFGVRPGHPFLFTIPATGDRPMTFGVEDLPAGLAVDSVTGQITGQLAEAGQYLVTFTAANRLGKATRKLKIVCGDTLALTPHMGWNSWYVWESHVTDAIVRAAADAMVSSGMIDHGYQYVNIDDCWAVETRVEEPVAGRRTARRSRQGQCQRAFPRHEGVDRLHPLEGTEGGDLHLAGADHLRRTRWRI